MYEPIGYYQALQLIFRILWRVVATILFTVCVIQWTKDLLIFLSPIELHNDNHVSIFDYVYTQVSLAFFVFSFTHMLKSFFNSERTMRLFFPMEQCTKKALPDQNNTKALPASTTANFSISPGWLRRIFKPILSSSKAHG